MKFPFFACIFCLSVKAFSTTWGVPTTISSPNASSSQIAINGSGDAAAIWSVFNGSYETAEAAIYVNEWSIPLNLSFAGQNPFEIFIKFNDLGNGLAIWRQFDGSNYVIQSSYYSNGSWGTPQTISDAGFTASQARIEFNNLGNALAVWSQQTDAHQVIKSAFFSNGIWTAPQIISNSDNDATDPDLAFSDAGIGLAVWSEFDSSFFDVINTASFVGDIWNAPQVLSYLNDESVAAHVVINSLGNGMAIWESVEVAANQIYTSRFQGTLWSTPQLISTPNMNASSPDIVMNNSGNAIAAWQCNGDEIYANTFFSGFWGVPQSISAQDEILPFVMLSMDANGDGNAVWTAFKEDSNTCIRSTQFSSGFWHPPTTLSDPVLSAYDPKIVENGAGDAFCIWDGFDGTNYVVQAVAGS